MSTSYHAAIIDHLAECMLYLSTASSFWFSLNLAHGRSILGRAVVGSGSDSDSGSGEGGGGVGGYEAAVC